MSDAAVKRAAEAAAQREKEAKEEAAFHRKQQQKLSKKLKVAQQEKLVGSPCSYWLCQCRLIHVAVQGTPVQVIAADTAVTSGSHIHCIECCRRTIRQAAGKEVLFWLSFAILI